MVGGGEEGVKCSVDEPVQDPDAAWPVRSCGAASVGRTEGVRCVDTRITDSIS